MNSDLSPLCRDLKITYSHEIMKDKHTISDIIVDITIAVNKKQAVSTYSILLSHFFLSCLYVYECVNACGYLLRNDVAGRNITNCKTQTDTC